MVPVFTGGCMQNATSKLMSVTFDFLMKTMVSNKKGGRIVCCKSLEPEHL